MLSIIRVLALVSFMLFSSVSVSKNIKSDNIGHDAYYWNQLIGKGVNLGNAFEMESSSGQDYIFDREHFSIIKDKGFDSVRIPIRWSIHTSEMSPYNIDKDFFEYMDSVIDSAIASGLVVIINVHHYHELMKAPKFNKERFLSIWRQISERYKGYSSSLYFEVLNQPSKNLTNILWNQYMYDALSIIRLSNPKRAVLIGPVNLNRISGLASLKLPTSDSNIILTIHYYEPFEFTHQGAHWAGKKSQNWLGRGWAGSESDLEKMRSDFMIAAKWAKANNVPLNIGEFGVYRKADVPSKIKWIKSVVKLSNEFKMSFNYWEFGSGFGLYDFKKNVWHKHVSALFSEP
jgi:endoglucanase